MMKPALIFLLFLNISFAGKGNSIDKLKTLDDVKTFLKKTIKVKQEYPFFDVIRKDSSEKLASQPFLKIDLNDDGLTDLIINGNYLFALIDDGTNHFKTYYIERGAFITKNYILSNVDTSEKQPKVIIKIVSDTPVKKILYDTLIVKFGGFVEYTKQPENTAIKEVSLSTGRCFGTCPVFNMSVLADGIISYEAKMFNKKDGLFSGKIGKSDTEELFNLVHYIHVKTLSDKYAVDWTDDQPVVLKVTFEDGTFKNIKDYGKLGTFGLERLYSTLFALRDTVKWHTINH